MNALRWLSAIGLLVLALLKIAVGVGITGIGGLRRTPMAPLEASLTVAATVGELVVALLLMRTRHYRIGAWGMAALGACFATWLGYQQVTHSFSGRCRCFGPYDLTVTQHLAVACGLVVLGASLLLLGSAAQPASSENLGRMES